MRWTVTRLAEITGGRALRDAGREVEGAFFDSRRPRAGGLFVPIVAARDGHDFIPQAVAGGAAAILQVRGRALPAGDMSVIEVEDTLAAFTALARDVRDRFTGPVIAITGSNGKTTTRGMIAAALACEGGFQRVLCTQGNFNNNIGVPMTLTNGPDEPDAMVIELGMNAPGEVDALASVVRPTGAVITSVAVEHLEFMGSIEAIAAAEAEVVRHVELAPARESDVAGFVLIPGDEPRLRAHAPVEVGRARVLGFADVSPGWSGDTRVTVASVEVGRRTRCRLRLPDAREVALELRLFGAHNARNAAAALSVGLELGLPLAAMIRALEAFEPIGDRGRVLELGAEQGGHWILADCYNANPGSVEVALASLAALEVPGRRVAVLGDMLELGPDEDRYHAEVGAAAARRGVIVLGVGPRARATVRAARAAGGVAEHLGATLDADAVRGVARSIAARLGCDQRGAVLVKGSRGMALERLVEALLESRG